MRLKFSYFMFSITGINDYWSLSSFFFDDYELLIEYLFIFWRKFDYFIGWFNVLVDKHDKMNVPMEANGGKNFSSCKSFNEVPNGSSSTKRWNQKVQIGFLLQLKCSIIISIEVHNIYWLCVFILLMQCLRKPSWYSFD